MTKGAIFPLFSSFLLALILSIVPARANCDGRIDHTYLPEIIQKARTSWQTLHANPELSSQEFATQAHIKQRLEKLGIKGHAAATTGWLAIVEGSTSEEGPTLALKVDIDALPIEESHKHPSRSKVEGVMHACAHDLHTAIGLGVAEYFHLHRKKWSGKLLVFFQPEEEKKTKRRAGARAMVYEGYLEKYAVDAVIGLHASPNFKVGEFAIAEGPILAQSDSLDIEIVGRATHVAQPQDGVDAIEIAAKLVSEVRRIEKWAQTATPELPLGIRIGKLSAGSSANILAPSAKLKGTIRTLLPLQRRILIEELKRVSAKLETESGAKIRVRVKGGTPVLVNDGHLFERAKLSFSNPHELVPALFADDFAYYSQRVPGFYFVFGSLGPEGSGPLHSPTYRAGKKSLEVALKKTIELIDNLSKNR